MSSKMENKTISKTYELSNGSYVTAVRAMLSGKTIRRKSWPADCYCKVDLEENIDYINFRNHPGYSARGAFDKLILDGVYAHDWERCVVEEEKYVIEAEDGEELLYREVKKDNRIEKLIITRRVCEKTK